MKIIAVNGSPRKNWNTDTLLRKALEGAAYQNAEVELVNLYDLKYRGCTSCFICKKKGAKHGICAIKDDLTPVLEKLKKADAIIFGSPIYFMTISSGMAAFLERFLFSLTIYSKETATVLDKVIPSAYIYTMNANEKQIEPFKEKLNCYEWATELFLGQTPEKLYSYNTYQFTDYDSYESSMFSKEEKAEYRINQFPIDCEKAFQLGAKLSNV